MAEQSRIDVVHLDLGSDGHVASLFPRSRALSTDSGSLVAMNEDPSGRHPLPRMTLTYAGIARARMVVVTVSGKSKRDVLARVAARDPDVPATHIDAEKIVWIADTDAAKDALDVLSADERVRHWLVP